jgi:hypothetical protein
LSDTLYVHMKRDATQTIWRTVVFAGAMLGAPACGSKKPANTTPSNNATPAATEAAPTTDNATPPDPAAAADPCEGGERPRGNDPCGGGGGMGRGFVLS